MGGKGSGRKPGSRKVCSHCGARLRCAECGKLQIPDNEKMTTTFTASQSTLEAIDAAAKEAGVSRSEYITSRALGVNPGPRRGRKRRKE